MKRTVSLATTLTLMATLSSHVFSPPAQANDLLRVFSGVTGATDIDARQAQLDRRIVDAVLAGRLTAQEADSYKADLNRIAKEEADFKASGGTLNVWESLRLHFELDQLIKTLETRLSDRQVALTDVDARLGDLDRAIGDAVVARRLTPDQADDLKKELSRIASEKDSLKAADGSLTYPARLGLSLDLDRLNSRLQQQLSNRPIPQLDIDARQAELQQRIAGGISSGKLSSQEAQDLKKEFDRILATEATYKASSGRLRTNELISLGVDLDRLSNEIDRKLTNTEVAATEVDTLQSKLDKRISDELCSGRLTAVEAQPLKNELDRIQQAKQTLSGSDHKLSGQETHQLLVDLERLSGRIEQSVYEPQSSWAGIDGRQAQLEKTITEAVPAGRLTPQEGQDFKAELDRVAALKASMKASDGGLNATESMTLALELGRLDTNLEQKLHDRSASAPDPSARQADLDRRIGYGLSTGKLTLEEGRELKGELDHISAEKDSFKSSNGGLDYRETLMLAIDLERLGTRLEKLINDGHYSAPAMSSQLALINRKIADALAQGELTQQEGRDLLDESNRIAQSKAAMRASGGGLTAEEGLALVADVQHLDDRVEWQLHERQHALSDVDARAAELDRRISQGVATGRLTVSEADSLKKSLDRIGKMEDQFKATAGGLSYGERLTLAFELERLSSEIETEMREKQIALPDVDARQADLDKQIAKGIVAGTLTLKEAEDLKGELDRIAALEVNYRASGGGLSYSEVLTLSLDLDRLSGRIDRETRDRQFVWEGIDGQLAEVSKQVSAAVASGKLSTEEAQNLQGELDRISSLKNTYQTVGRRPGLNELLGLARDLNRLSSRIDVTLKERQIAWSNIDARQANLNKRINEAAAAGKLSSKETQKIKADSDKLRRLKAVFNASGGLDNLEIAFLARELDRLDSHVNRLLGQR